MEPIALILLAAVFLFWKVGDIYRHRRRPDWDVVFFRVASRAGLEKVPAIVRSVDDLFGLAPGEVLVCDAIDPNMTFVVPLASAVVERRGGMLIHGAIIAREDGLPCVTGVSDALRRIRDGDELTVDGYLGIVTVRRTEPAERDPGPETGPVV